MTDSLGGRREQPGSPESSGDQSQQSAFGALGDVVLMDERNVHRLSGVPGSFKIFAHLVERIQWGALVFVLPDGRALKFAGHEAQDQVGVLEVRDYRFARRIMLGGSMGLFESFADDMWESPDLAQFLRVCAANADRLQDYIAGNAFIRQINRFMHLMRRNTKAGSKRNIMAHYDLGNAFYERWLDRTMTYSSAKFQSPDQALADAQQNKYAELAKRIELRPDESILEIGSGWGGFAEYAAKNVGAKVTGITISREQYDYARARMFREGLADKVDIRFQDYRDVEDKFDKAASIEMFEAVGKEYWPTYFSKVRDCLKPGGLAGFQIITIADRFYPAYEKTADFIQKYVFPGGMLPSPTALQREIEQAGLAWRGNVNFGRDYADTLKAWHDEFLARWDEIKPLGFDDKFKKLWRYYLAYCEAGFRAATIDVTQVAVSRNP